MTSALRGLAARHDQASAAEQAAGQLADQTYRAIGAHYGGITAAAVRTIHRKTQQAEHAARPAIDTLLPRLSSARRRKVDT